MKGGNILFHLIVKGLFDKISTKMKGGLYD